MKQCRVCGVEKLKTEFHTRNDTGKIRNECKTCHADAQMRRNYGIGLAEYNKLYEEQGGVCKICHLPQSDARNKRLCVDHNHEDGHVRGLLCSHCNRGIGLLKDDYRLAQAAAEYLRADEVRLQGVSGAGMA